MFCSFLVVARYAFLFQTLLQESKKDGEVKTYVTTGPNCFVDNNTVYYIL